MWEEFDALIRNKTWMLEVDGPLGQEISFGNSGFWYKALDKQLGLIFNKPSAQW